MDDRNAQVGWTEAQWNRVREEVLQAWQRVRVAGSFLPIYGPLPPSTQVVPSEVLKADGSVDDRATAALIEIDLRVKLSRQQIWEEDLSSALLQFRRRATQLGQLEDWFIFNGTYPSTKPKDQDAFIEAEKYGHSGYRPELAYLNARDPSQGARISGTPTPIEGGSQDYQITGMLQRNPGSLGLIGAPREELAKEVKRAEQSQRQAEKEQQLAPTGTEQERQMALLADDARQRAEYAQQRVAKLASDKPKLDNDGLMEAIVWAINSLEDNGYVAPYVCVFGRNPFEAAFKSIDNSTVLPRDRIEPLIGRELLHASGIDILPQSSSLYGTARDEWQSRGVLLSMANESIDLALAAEATPEFRQVNEEGHYVFSVFERFALRIKDAKAIVPLMFEKPPAGGSTAARSRAVRSTTGGSTTARSRAARSRAARSTTGESTAGGSPSATS
jgi:uncharacterized linocin/CFP29 family protein